LVVIGRVKLYKKREVLGRCVPR